MFVSIESKSQESCPSQRLLKQKLQQVLDDQANSLGVKGLSAAISLPDNKVITLVSGYSYGNIKVDPQMLFGAGSLTKNLIAPIILQLFEERKLSLNDPIYKYFQDHVNIDRNTTIKELLSHTSGISSYTNNPMFFPTVFSNPLKVWIPEELFSYVPLPSFAHGTSWEYSNTNYIILGVIIKKITGNDVVAELNKRIFNPLHLSSTFFYPDEPYSGILSHIWMDTTDYTFLAAPSLFSCAWTAGGIITTPSDLVKWSKGLYGGKILRPMTLRKMEEPCDFNPNYGLGTMLLDVNGQTTYGHLGDILYNSYVNYFPDDKLSIAVMGNKAGSPMQNTMLALYSAYKTYSQKQDKPKIKVDCYPNPFTTSVNISYELKSKATVSLKISNIYNKTIVVLVNNQEQYGKQTFNWNGLNSNNQRQLSGIYVYTLILNGETYSGTIVKQ